MAGTKPTCVKRSSVLLVDTVPIIRRAAAFAAKILRGAKPSDLPVEQPTNFEFALNLKTAKAIGMSVPTSILLRADEVIE